jgi:hypothetical protein
MIRPGALESKKRCHDLLHRESEKGIYYLKVRIVRKNLPSFIIQINSNGKIELHFPSLGILKRVANTKKGQVSINLTLHLLL